MEKEKENKRLIISHLTLRRVLGLFGLFLPVILVLGCFALGSYTEIQPSISDYYHTAMRDIFVGVLFAIGLFLFAYKGHEPIDDRMGDLGCLFALGVALFPTGSPIPAIHTLHFISAALLFSVFSYFSLVLFTKSGGHPTKQKEKRNRVYRICGGIMVLCILGIGVYAAFFKGTAADQIKPVLLGETIALWAFGFSWLVKGETLWKDI